MLKFNFWFISCEIMIFGRELAVSSGQSSNQSLNLGMDWKTTPSVRIAEYIRIRQMIAYNQVKNSEHQ